MKKLTFLSFYTASRMLAVILFYTYFYCFTHATRIFQYFFFFHHKFHKIIKFTPQMNTNSPADERNLTAIFSPQTRKVSSPETLKAYYEEEEEELNFDYDIKNNPIQEMEQLSKCVIDLTCDDDDKNQNDQSISPKRIFALTNHPNKTIHGENIRKCMKAPRHLPKSIWQIQLSCGKCFAYFEPNEPAIFINKNVGFYCSICCRSRTPTAPYSPPLCPLSPRPIDVSYASDIIDEEDSTSEYSEETDKYKDINHLYKDL
jgi:hypothetical protein